MRKFNDDLTIRKVISSYGKITFEVYDAITQDIYSYNSKDIKSSAHYIIWNNLTPVEQQQYLDQMQK